MTELIAIGLALGLIGLVVARPLWRALLFSALIMMVYEGAFRKWLFPGLQGPIYFVKDGMILLAFAGFLMSPEGAGVHKKALEALKVWVWLLVPFCFVEAFNPQLPSILVGIFGLKSYLLYVPIAFMVPNAVRSTADLQNKIKIFMYFMIPVALLGFIQFMLPPDHWINTYVQQDVDQMVNISQFGEHNNVRTSGTFSFIGGYATFIQAMFAFSLGAGLIARKESFKRLAFILLGLCSIGMFTTGSRATVYGCLQIGAVTFALCAMQGLISAKTIMKAIGAAALISLVANFAATEAIEAFQYRAEHADDPIARVFTPLTELLLAFDVTPVLGMGVGANANGSAQIMGLPGGIYSYWWLHGNYFEVETARVMQEVGPFGFLLVYGMRVALVLSAARMARVLRTPWMKSVAAAIAGFFILHLGLYVINNPTAGIFYWFAVGLLYAMYRLDREPVSASGNSPASFSRPAWSPVAGGRAHVELG